MLPLDLRAAEEQTLGAVLQAVAEQPKGRWSIEWRFEGLRLLAPVLRLVEPLRQAADPVVLLFSDAGGAALARRDAPSLAQQVLDFGQLHQRQQERASEGLLLAVGPAAADYERFEQLCQNHSGAVVMVNGRLEDASVGIGSVARERRRGFVATWQSAYALLPLEGGALRRAFPGPWELYRQDPDGFRLAARFDQKPDLEAQVQALAGEQGAGVGGNLRVLDAFIEGLRS